MRFRMLTRKNVMVLSGILLIALGGASLVRAQRQPVRQVIQVGNNRAYLGITMEDVTADKVAKYKLSGETGVIIRTVEKGSPAEAAHLQENDVILEYAGIPVFSVAELARLVQETPVSRTVGLVVSRDGKKLTLTVKVAERNESGLFDRNQVLPGTEPGRLFDFNGRQFSFNQPGGGVFQFRVPGGNNQTYRYIQPSRPQLGVTVELLTDQMATFLGVPGKKGVLVNSVVEGSTAASALRAGDVILSIDGKAITEPTDLTQELAKKEPGSKVDLKIVRDKKDTSVSIELPKSGTARGGSRVCSANGSLENNCTFTKQFISFCRETP